MTFGKLGFQAVILCASLAIGAANLQAQAKVAIINLQKAVLDTAEIVKAQKELETKFKPRQDQIETIQRDLQTIQAQLSAKITPLQEQDLTVRGQRKQRELQRLTEDLQADVDRERNEILQRSGDRMQTVVKKLSEAAGYDVVVDVSNTVFFKPALDITKAASDEYNKAYPVK